MLMLFHSKHFGYLAIKDSVYIVNQNTMKVFSAAQIKALDLATIRQEPISSTDLMERAANVCFRWLYEIFFDTKKPVFIFCGMGNNGGDGLVISRLFLEKGYSVVTYLCPYSNTPSEDFSINLNRLRASNNVTIHYLKEGVPFPSIPPAALLIDAIFGSGLNRPVTGYWGKLIQHLNQLEEVIKVAIDLPSGLFADQTTSGIAFKADYTFSFEAPKLAFFPPENNPYVGKWVIGKIGLDEVTKAQMPVDYYYVSEEFLQGWIKPRNKYDHKGTFGHALLIAGSYGKIGAAVLAARACLRIGTGLLTTHLPNCGYSIMQTAVPEAMVQTDQAVAHVSQIELEKSYQSIGIGCGLGQAADTLIALEHLLDQIQQPIVLDADALNLIAHQPKLFQKIPPKSILTPHPKEFERLFGKTANHFDRLNLQRERAKSLQLIIVLKGAHTSIALPDGSCYFNSTGNPGMATAGSGDVLTGVITGLLAQGYSSEKSTLLGIYLHGLAGDFAAQALGQSFMLASDIIHQLGNAFRTLEEK